MADGVRLPANAFRELAPGETYQPVVAPGAPVPEVTLRSIAQGVIWSVVFSAAATYIALKLGQGIESAIPISILAVGFSVLAVKALKRRGSSLLENVNVLAIGATSGIVAGGSVFTMPAVYILGLEVRGQGSGFRGQRGARAHADLISVQMRSHSSVLAPRSFWYSRCRISSALG